MKSFKILDGLESFHESVGISDEEFRVIFERTVKCEKSSASRSDTLKRVLKEFDGEDDKVICIAIYIAGTLTPVTNNTGVKVQINGKEVAAPGNILEIIKKLTEAGGIVKSTEDDDDENEDEGTFDIDLNDLK